jgi:raffinose/stachyose/melibiose transport system substrate-binding protein
MKPRRVVFGLLVAAMTIMVTGISQGVASTSTKPKTGLLGPLPTKKITLTVWDEYPDNMIRGKAQDAINRAFEKLHPNITIKHVGLPYAVITQKDTVAINTKTGPDVLGVPNTVTQYYKGLVPLAPLITPAFRKSIQWFAWDQIDPSIHQVPYTTYLYYWVYNKALFAKAGVSAPPTTWGQLLADCGKFNAVGIVPMAAGFTDGYFEQQIYPGIAAQLMTPQQQYQWNITGKLGWTSPIMHEIIADMLQLVTAKCFAPSANGTAYSDAVTQFTGGNAAMFYTYSGLADYATPLGSNLGAFRMPDIPGAVQPHAIQVGPHWGYGVTRWTKNCPAALSYVQFIESPEAQRIQYNIAGIYPNNLAVTIKPKNLLDALSLKWLKIPTDNGAIGEVGPQESAADLKALPQLMTGQISEDQYLASNQTVRQSNPSAFTSPTLAPPVQCKSH